jgi:hypothetical protein
VSNLEAGLFASAVANAVFSFLVKWHAAIMLALVIAAISVFVSASRATRRCCRVYTSARTIIAGTLAILRSAILISLLYIALATRTFI